MKYFYLSDDSSSRGGFSADELRTLRASGVIHEGTLIYSEDDSTPRPYRELELEGEFLGNCPFCGRGIIGIAPPTECPHCDATLHSAGNNPWEHFRSCLRRYVCFRGRASRTEFWSFFLICCLIILPLGYIWTVAVWDYYAIPHYWMKQFGESDDSVFLFLHYGEGDFVATLGRWCLVLFFLMPLCGAIVRRLHDRGHKAVSLILFFVGFVLFQGALTMLLYVMSPLFMDPALGEEILNETLSADPTNLILVLLIGVPGMLLSVASFFFMLISCLMPGKKGANKYGPSVL